MSFTFNPFTGEFDAIGTPSTGTGTGDVVGPASATDNAIARYDTTTGKLIQNSSATIADDGTISATSVSAGSSAFTSININGTNGNGHIHLKHQASDPSSQASSSTIFADNNGNPAWLNDGLSKFTLDLDGITAARTATFQDASGTVAYLSDITGAGSPGGSDTQIQFNDAGSFGGDPNLTWDSAGGILAVTNKINLTGGGSINATGDGAGINIIAHDAVSSGVHGGNFVFGAGNSLTSGNGGGFDIGAGGGTGATYKGGDFQITTGSGDTGANAGDFVLNLGSGNGATDGKFKINPKSFGIYGILNFDNIATTDKTYTFPNTTGTIALTSDLASKQDTLVSGTNIKTVNGNSLLGSGDVSISSSVAWGGITGTLSSQTDLNTALNGKVAGNTAITGATKTKITYDTKGLVIAGADATTADIADSLNKRYVTDAQLTVIGNTSGTNTGDQTSIVGITGTKAQFNTAVTDGDIVFLDSVDTITGAKTFATSTLKQNNPAGTFAYTIVPSAIAAARNLTLPLLTADDTVAVLGLAQTFTAAKTFTSAAPQLTLGANTTTLGSIKMFGNTSGDVTLQPTAVAGTATVQTLPATTGTLVNRVTTAAGVSATNTDGALSFTLGAITPSSVSATGAITSSGAGIGYATGAGGTVTQLTSRTTGVTLNKLSGTITMFSAAVAAAASSTFTFTNSFIAATDIVLVTHNSATNACSWICEAIAGAGSASVVVKNVSAASITEATPLKFIVIKAVSA